MIRRALRSLPFRRRVALLVLASSAIAVVLFIAGVGAFEVADYRSTLVGEVTALANVTAQSAKAPLAFSDAEAANAALQALAADPHVVSADLLATDRRVFATYRRAGDVASAGSADPGGFGHWFSAGLLVVARPIGLGAEPVGTLVVRSDLSGVYGRLRMLAAISLLALVGSLLVASVLTRRLQRSVTQPILDLAGVALRIGETKDFALRAPTGAPDEVGNLGAAFNQMLVGLEEREHALAVANDSLRTEIHERVAADRKIQTQLASLELLNGITRAIGDRQDLPSLFRVVASSLEEDLPIACGCFCLYDAPARSLQVAGVGAPGGELATRAGLGLGAILAADPVTTFEAAFELRYVPDTRQAESELAGRLAAQGLLSLVAAPLVVERELFGVLIAARQELEGFSSNECQFLRQLTEQVALAAHQMQVHLALQRAYDDLRQTQQAAMQQERLRALGEMASGVAHDINNAIAPIVLYGDMLVEEDPNLSPQAREYLALTQRALGDVTETISRMREFYRHRQPLIAMKPVRIDKLLQQVADLTRPRWSTMPLASGVVNEMVIEPGPEPLTIHGVESELREALTNLVFNAVDAMPEGGRIVLRTRAEDGPAPARRRLLIEVIDGGVGMDDETRRRCLEPFFTTKGERGTGLGLAMVYGAVQRHSGDIEIDSAPGRGTRFCLAFSELEESRTATESRAVPRIARLRLLAVDDDPLVLRAISRALELDGHIVQTANGGKEGIDAFRAALDKGEPFAVVFTDLGMPRVDGRRVAAAVKEAAPRTPVVLVTGWGQRVMSDEGLPLHVDRILSKPPKLAELRATLADLAQAHPSA
jgi:signal transduction histidine kinase/ActR/RegA family two-component response regulator